MLSKPFLVLALAAAVVLSGCVKQKEEEFYSGKTTSATTTSTGPHMDTCSTLANQTFELSYADDAVGLWDTTLGCIAVEIYTVKAPITGGNFVNLTKSGFYDGTRFHRVIDGFMIQDGDPNSKDPSKKASWGTGGPGYEIQDEFPCMDGSVSHDAGDGSAGNPKPCDEVGGLLFKHTGEGILSMANSGPNTGGSQYFITLAATAHLDGKHAIFGKVVGGMDVVKAIGKTPKQSNDQPTTDIIIYDLRLHPMYDGS